MRLIIGMMLSLFLLAFVATGVSVYLYKNTRSEQAKTIIIEPRTGTRDILAQLHREGLVPALPLMVVPVLITADHQSLKAGEYEFAGGMSPAQIIQKIIRGEVVIHKVTIPEGWTSYQVREALLKEPLLVGEVPAFAEGSLLPDTMHFRRGETRASVIARMQKAQTELMEKLWPTRAANLPYQTPAEALIMASIVERETGEVDERAMVAGVFVNRLARGMLLQTDPAVMYGIEQKQGGAPMTRLLSRADLKADTPYNTYTRAGLTPTPICHPGRKAIEAALNPATTDALYFVATGTGGHRFATTLKEHNANVAAYRKVMGGG
jgi:UPF0755 protein